MKTAFAIQLRRKEMDDLEESLRTEIKSKRRKATAKDGLYYRPTVLTKSRVVKNEDQWETLFHWLDGMPGVASRRLQSSYARVRPGRVNREKEATGICHFPRFRRHTLSCRVESSQLPTTIREQMFTAS